MSLSRARRWLAGLLALAGAALVVGLGAYSANANIGTSAEPYNGLSFRLQGCNLTAGTTLPISGKYICPDAQYSDGNLGKNWNELDLVPHRVLISAGNHPDSTYHFQVEADNKVTGSPDKNGYDFISAAPEQVTGGCTVSFGPLLTRGSGTNSDPFVIYRDVTVTNQQPNTTCQIDYYMRLALGAHLWPGSSLHSRLANNIGTQSGIGNKENSIPVNAILPQKLSKDMTASESADNAWSVVKGAEPAHLDFENTCATGAPLSKSVAVTVTWQKVTSLSGITVITHVYATNPAARTITTNVTDKIFSGTTLLDTVSSGDVDVPANTTQLVLTHTTSVPAGSTDLNDLATASYTDKVTGVPVPGQTTATASSDVQLTTHNGTAVINDSESISGTGLTFSVDSTDGASGSFSGYTPGDKTTGPVDWTSDTQSGDGSVKFNKTVFLDQPRNTTGSLTDTATVTGSDGFTTTGDTSVDIKSEALVALTIGKTIPNVLSGSETQTFTFDVKDSQGNVVASPSIKFAAGQTNNAVTVPGLAPGTYTVSEEPATGWDPQADQVVTIALPNCSGMVRFDNTITPANAKAVKVTNPPGNESGWEMTLTGPGTGPGGEQVVTGSGSNPANEADFTTQLEEGSYTITETGTRSGWDETGTSGDCSFTVDYPADSARTFTCTITNQRRPRLTVIKHVINDNGGSAGASAWKIHVASGGGGDVSGSPQNGSETGTTYTLDPGDYHVGESDGPGGYAQTGITGACDSGGSVTLAYGDDKTCTITNDDIAPKLHLRKIVVNDNGGTLTKADFPLLADGSGTNDLSGTDPVDSGPGLKADTWTLSETNKPGYAASNWSCNGGQQSGNTITVGLGGEATCTITNNDIQPKLTLVKKVVNDNGDTLGVSNFPLFVNTTQVTSGAANGFNAGTYTAGETQQYGYAASAWGGDCAANGSVTLKVGDDKTCTITNDDVPGKIVIVKNAKPQNGVFTFTTGGSSSGPGTSWPSSFTLTGSTTGGGNTRTFTLDAGAYSAKESTQLSWVLTGIGGSSDPNFPYNCTVTGSGGSTGSGNLSTATVSINLKNADTVTCVFENTGNGATRTQGFWATHAKLADIAWNGGSGFNHTFPGVSDKLLCGKTITIDALSANPLPANSELMGGFWAGVSSTSTGGKRSTLGNSRMQLLQQLLAAELNGSAFGSTPTTGSFAAWETAFCTGTAIDVKNAQQQAASFNSQGDSGTFTPGTSADSKFARSIANIAFWDSVS